MPFDLREVPRVPQAAETMPEMPDTREDDLVGGADVGGGSDPGDFVAAFFDRVHEAADVAGDIVEQVDGGHYLLVVVVVVGWWLIGGGLGWEARAWIFLTGGCKVRCMR